MNSKLKKFKIFIIVSLLISSFTNLYAAEAVKVGIQIGRPGEGIDNRTELPNRGNEILSPNEKVAVGDIIQVDVLFENFNGTNAAGFQASLFYDSRQVRLVSGARDSFHLPARAQDHHLFKYDDWDEVYSHNLNIKNNEKPNAISDIIILSSPSMDYNDGLPIYKVVSEKRFASFFFEIKEGTEGEDIKFSLPKKIGSEDKILVSDTKVAIPFEVLTEEISIGVLGDEPVVEPAKVTDISVKGSVDGNIYNYFEGMFVDGVVDYKSSEMIVPNAVDVLDYKFFDEEDELLNVTTIKVNELGARFGDDLKLHVGDNYFTSIIKDDDDSIISEYEFKVKRLSNNVDIDFKALANSEVLNASNNIFKFKYLTDSINLSASKVSDKYSYQGSNYTYISESTITFDNILDTSNKNVKEFSVDVIVTPEDALSKFSGVLGNVASASKTYTYKFNRMSNDTSLNNVKLFDLDNNDLGESVITNNVYQFNVESSVENAKLEFNLNDSNSTYTTNPSDISNIKINSGNTKIEVFVVAEDGTKVIYEINVNKQAKANNNLESLGIEILDGSTPVLNENLNEPNNTITLDNLEYSENYKISLNPKVYNNVGSSIKSNEGYNKVLVVGENSFKIVVSAEDGSEKAYTINVKVLENASSKIEEDDVNINIDEKDLVNPNKPLTPGNESSEGDINVFEYNLDVKYSKKTFGKSDLDLKVPFGASITYPNDINLNIGDNKYDVLVVSQDKSSTSKYIFNINRAKNNKTNIEFNVITEPSATVSGSDFEYNIEVDTSVIKYELIVAAKDDSIIVSGGSGTYDLIDSNYVHKIVVKSQDGSSEETYNLNFNRVKNAEAKLNNLLIQSEDVNKDYINEITGGILNLELDSSWIKFTPKASHISSSVTVNNNTNLEHTYNLDYDKTNRFDVKVISETGSWIMVTVNVVRTPSSNAKLENLEYKDQGTYRTIPGFTAGNDYVISDLYDENVKNFDVRLEKSDEKSIVNIYSNNKLISSIASGILNKEFSIPLDYGENNIRIEVVAHNKLTKETYTILVNKELSSNTDLGSGGIEVDGNNDHQILPTGNSKVYKAYVPFGTSTYSKDDFKVDLIDYATIEYEHDSIDLDTEKSPNGIFEFNIIAQNGIDKTKYSIEVHILEGDNPLLNSIRIAGQNVNNFDNKKFEHTINLSDFDLTSKKQFVFEVVGDESKYTIEPAKLFIVDILGLSSINQEVVLIGNNGFNSTYKFTFINTLSNIADLSDLSIQGNEELIDFDKDITDYKVVVESDVSQIEVKYKVLDETSSVVGGGKYDLKAGKNTINIEVTSEDGSNNKIYTIEVYREFALDELNLGGKDILDKSIASVERLENSIIYTVIDSYNADDVIVDLVANASNGISLSSIANNKVELALDGAINFDMRSIANDVVSVTIHYKREASDDSTLKSLKLNKQVIDLIDGKFDYDIVVDPTFKQVLFTDFEFVSNHQNASVFGEESMEISQINENVYELTVTAENKTEKSIYEIKIVRGAYNFLENLKIEDGQGYFYDIFDKNTLNYDALVYSNVSTFSFEWEALDGVEVINASELKNIIVNGSDQTFVIKVADGAHPEIREYVVKVSFGVSDRLASLVSSHGKLDFKPDKTNYTVYVPTESTSVLLSEIVAEDNKAEVTIKGKKVENNEYNVILLEDDTIVEILVYNQGIAKNYSITFVKISDMTNIDKVVVSDGKHNYNSNINNDGNLEVLVDSNTNLDNILIDVVLEFENGTFEVVEVSSEDGSKKYTISVTDENGITKEYDLIIKNELSDNNYLSFITVNNKLVADFDKNKASYTYYINYDELFDVAAKAEDHRATVTIDDTSNVANNDIVKITVTSQSGNVRYYYLTVSKGSENIAVLESLNLKEANILPVYNKLVSKYYVSVPYDLEKVTVVFTASENVVVTVNGSSGRTVNLAEGNNTINVKVAASDNSEFTYVINVERNKEASNYLNSLTVQDAISDESFKLSPNFNKDQLLYNVKVKVSTEKVLVSGSYADDLIVSGLNEIINLDNNLVTHQIKVVEKGITRVYTINFIKEASSEAYLVKLDSSVGNLNPMFSSDHYLYELKVGSDVSSVNLDAFANENSMLVGDGIHNLSAGKNIISIVVTAEDKITQVTYNVVIIRDMELLNVNIADKIYGVTKVDKTTYKLNTKIDSDVVVSKVIPNFNDNTIMHSGLENMLSFALNGSFNFEMIARDGETSKNITVEYERLENDNAHLENLFINNKEIELIENVYEYNVEVPYNLDLLIKDKDIAYTTVHPNTEVISDNSISIEYNKENVYIIKTIAEDGSQLEYKINIIKASYETGASTLLESMKVSTGKLEFIPEKFFYKIKISDKLDKVKLSSIIPQDKNADVSSNYKLVNNSIEVDFSEYKDVKITVENEGKVSIYTVVFERVAFDSSISNVNVNDGNKIWQAKINEEGKYEVIVDEGINLEDLKVDVILDNLANVEIVGPEYNINTGEYEYKIVISDSNGNSEEFDLSVIVDLSSNAYLKSLEILKSNLVGFNKHTNEYTYVIKKDVILDVIDIDAEAEDDDASVEVNIVDNHIIISVIAANKKENIYTVHLEYEEAKIAMIENLGLLEVAISPRFNINESRYYATIPYEMDSVNVFYKVIDNVSVVINSISDVSDNKISNLIVGTNIIDIVISNSEVSYTYTIYVDRNAKSENNVLNNLGVVDFIDSKIEYNLDPIFDKNTLAYNVELPHDINTINIIGDYDGDLMVSGVGSLVIDYFPYVHSIRVVDENSIVRVYTITFTKAKSDNSYLANLSVSDGYLNPIFKKDVTSYIVDVDYDISSLEIDYVVGSDDQEVIGAGLKALGVGLNVFEVIVTSGNSKTTYTINVNRKNPSPKLSNLSVSEGELSPEFNSNRLVYSVSVEYDVSQIEVLAESVYEVFGTGIHDLAIGNNLIEVTTSVDDAYSTYYINVYRKSEDIVINDDFYSENLELVYLDVIGEKLNENFNSKQLSYTSNLSKSYYENLDIIAIARNPLANVEIINNKDLSVGVSTVDIIVSLANGKSQKTTIEVFINDYFLQSSIHNIEENYIKSVVENTSVMDLKNQMLNENEYLKVYEDGLELSDSDIVGSGSIIKLVVNDKEYDSRIIIVLGDVNGDGEVDVADRMQTQSYVLGGSLSEIQMLAADVTLNELVEISDVMLIQAHILKIVNIYEREGN